MTQYFSGGAVSSQSMGLGLGIKSSPMAPSSSALGQMGSSYGTNSSLGGIGSGGAKDSGIGGMNSYSAGMNLKKNLAYGTGNNDYGSNLNTPHGNGGGMGMTGNPSSLGLGTYGGTGSQSNFGSSSVNYVTNQSIGGGDDS
jgi:hypothetical protein